MKLPHSGHSRQLSRTDEPQEPQAFDGACESTSDFALKMSHAKTPTATLNTSGAINVN